MTHSATIETEAPMPISMVHDDAGLFIEKMKVAGWEVKDDTLAPFSILFTKGSKYDKEAKFGIATWTEGDTTEKWFSTWAEYSSEVRRHMRFNANLRS